MHISTKCSVALHCLVFISEYGTQGRITSKLLAASTGVNPVTIRNILSALKKAGIIDVRAGTGGATLARAPERITVLAVTEALEPNFLQRLIGVHASPSELCPVGRNIHGVLDRTYQHVRDDMRHSLDGITLADVLAEYHQALEVTPEADAAPEVDAAPGAAAGLAAEAAPAQE